MGFAGGVVLSGSDSEGFVGNSEVLVVVEFSPDPISLSFSGPEFSDLPLWANAYPVPTARRKMRIIPITFSTVPLAIVNVTVVLAIRTSPTVA